MVEHAVVLRDSESAGSIPASLPILSFTIKYTYMLSILVLAGIVKMFLEQLQEKIDLDDNVIEEYEEFFHA